MYQILGIRRALGLFGSLCAVVFVFWAAIAPPMEPTLIGWWKIASGAVSLTAIIVTLIGQTRLFLWVCGLPILKKWFPPIDGNWTASLESNWPSIQQRPVLGSSPVLLAPVSASVQVIARLFYIRMNLESDNRYSASKTIFVQAARDAEDGSVRLHYIYRNSTMRPEFTDGDAHYGAGYLDVKVNNGEVWLEGVYWTNRNWHRGLNTAGKITLRRS